MIKKIFGSLIVGLMLTNAASAASLWLEGPASVDPGETFDIQLFGIFENGLNGGSVSLSYDADLISFDLSGFETFFSFNPALFSNLDFAFSCPNGVPGCESAEDGLIGGVTFSGGLSGSLFTASPDPVLLGTFHATAIDDAIGTEALAAFVLGAGSGGGFTNCPSIGGPPTFACTSIDGFSPTFNSAPNGDQGYSVDVASAVVPLPAAVWFMIGGLGSLLGFRRK